MALTHIKLGLINDSMNMLDHFVAQDTGLYKEEGLDVEFVIQTSVDSLKALDSGDVLVTSGMAWVIEAILRLKAPYRFVLINRREPPHSIIARPEIKNAQQLRGKTVWGAGPASINYYQTLDWLKENGLEPGVDVTVRGADSARGTFFEGPALPWAIAAARLTSDAIMMVPPESEWFVQEAGYNELVELCAHYPNLMVHALAVHPGTLRSKPELVRSVVRAQQRASQTIQGDRATTVSAMMKRWNVTKATAEKLWEKVHKVFVAETDPGALSTQLEFFRKHLEERFPGKTIDVPDPATLFNLSFAGEAAATR